MKYCSLSQFSNEVVGEPANHGCSFIKDKDVYYPLRVVPRGFCPALLHTVIPYFVTLWNGGWMRWTKRTRDSAKRRKIPQNASKIKNVNRLFCNEVIVQCPDFENGVVVGIGPKKDGEKGLMVRVLDVKKKCSLNMAIGDIFEFKPNEGLFCLEAFHKLYPYLLLKNTTGVVPFKKENTDSVIQCKCNKGKSNFIIPAFDRDNRSEGKFRATENIECGNYRNLIVSVNNIETKCRYHDSLVTYSENHFAPPGLCPDALHAAYPFALALMYDADFSGRERRDSVSVSCPNSDGIELLVKREERHSIFFLKFIKFLEKIFESVFYPVDRIYNNISLTVVSNRGGCPRGYHVNEKYFLNIDNQKVMCPASFNSIFPQLVWASYGSEEPEEKACLTHCPDCQGAGYVLKNRQAR